MDDAKANILLVDDNPDNLRFLAGIIAEQGYEVRPTKSGEMALRVRAKINSHFWRSNLGLVW